MADNNKFKLLKVPEGEMASLTNAYNWSETSVGSIDSWPSSLRTIVSLMLSSSFPMFLWWGKDLVQFYNDAYRPSLGQNGKHPLALGQNGESCWPEIWPVIFPLIEKVKNTGVSFYNENMLIPIFRNGKIEDVYWTFSYSAIENDKGKIDGVLVICNETTNAVQVQEQTTIEKLVHQKNELNLRKMIMQAPIAFCVFRGPHFIIETANELMCEFWGKPAAEIINKPLFDALPESKNQGYEELMTEVMRTGKPFSAKELPITLPRNGVIEKVYINFSYVAIIDDEGVISGIMASVDDVTEQVLSKEKIQQQVDHKTRELALTNNLLVQSNKELESFAYIASHDLKEPLRKVIAFSNMLSLNLEGSDNKSQQLLEKINRSTTRMTTLIDDILAFSQVSHSEYGFEDVNLKEVLLDVKGDFDLIIEQKKAQLILSVNVTLYAIPTQIRQLFANLISNSLKYSRNDVAPVIHISTAPLSEVDMQKYDVLKENQNYCLITVKDNGIGFEEQYSQKIFGLFQRLHGKSEYEGTGIGLAVCNKIVQNHGGYVSATSVLGESSTFNIILPCEPIK